MARLCLLYTVLTNPLGAGHSQYRGLYFILFGFCSREKLKVTVILGNVYRPFYVAADLQHIVLAESWPICLINRFFEIIFLRRFLCWGHHFPECWVETGFLKISKIQPYSEKTLISIRTYHVCCNDVRWTSRQAIYEWRKVFIINYEPKGRCIQQAR